MNGLVAALSFIVTLGILVTVHEFGHYWVARRCGVKVLTFSIGFGKALYRWQRGETTWQIAAIPLGGYVRMLDEREAPVAAADLDRAFNRQHPLKKMAVVVAGPAANLLLALLFYWVLFMVGVSTLAPVVGDVAVDTVASHVGIRVGDRIQRIDQTPVRNWDDIQTGLLDAASQGKKFSVQLQRNGRDVAVSIDPVAFGIESVDADTLSKLGVSPMHIVPQVSEVSPGSAAARAGIQQGDLLQSLDGQALTSWSMLQHRLAQAAGAPLRVGLLRHGQHLEVIAHPDVVTEKGKQIGRLGIAPTPDEQQWASQQMKMRYGPVAALGAAVNKPGRPYG